MKYTTLDKICENLDYMRKPITGKDRIEGFIPYYGASGVVDHVKDYIFDEELLLISEDGANLLSRTTPIAFSIRGKTWVNNHAHVLRFSDKKLQRFVELYLNGIKLDSYITGTAQPKLNQKMLNSIPIPFIDNEKISIIIKIMDKLQTIIEQRTEEIHKLDELIKARFIEMFGDPVSNPKGWEKKRLVEVCTKLNDGTHFSPESFETGDYKYITAKNIKIGGFDFSNITYVPESVHRPIYERCNPVKGDVLYIKDGVTTGIAMVNTLDEEFTLLSSVALLKQNREFMNGLFLCGVLNNDEMYSYIRRNMGGAAITRLTIAKLNEIIVIVPPLEIQEQYAAFVAQIDKSKSRKKLNYITKNRLAS